MGPAQRRRQWDIIKFRPRRNPINNLRIENNDVKADDVYYRLFNDEDPKRVGIVLFIKGYIEEANRKWAPLGYLFLDEALGEYDVETKVGL